MAEAVAKPKKHRRSLIGKEVIVGVLCLALGGYNLLNYYGYISYNYNAPQLAGNILLTLAGIFILVQAYKLARHEYIKSVFFH